MKKSTKLLLLGIKAESEDVFMKRIGEILEKNDLLEPFVNGMPIVAQVVDEADFLEHAAEKWQDRHNISIENPEIIIDGRGNLYMKIKYTRTVWFKTEKEAADANNNTWYSYKRDDYPFPGERDNHDTVDVTGMRGIEVLYV